MAKTQAERAKEYRQRKRDGNVFNSGEISTPIEARTGLSVTKSDDVTPNTDENVTVTKTESALLSQKQGQSVLSPAQSKTSGTFPKGVCKSCGGPTQHIKVVKCLKCCTNNVQRHAPNVKIGKATWDDLPKDVQEAIEQRCSENNNGERAASHSRAMMTERACTYQDRMGKRSGTGRHTVCQEPAAEPTNSPLDVYSQARWLKLEAIGYVFEGAMAYKRTPHQTLVAPPVPGDPAYRVAV